MVRGRDLFHQSINQPYQPQTFEWLWIGEWKRATYYSSEPVIIFTQLHPVFSIIDKKKMLTRWTVYSIVFHGRKKIIEVWKNTEDKSVVTEYILCELFIWMYYLYLNIPLCLLWNLAGNTTVEGEWKHGFGEGCRTCMSSEQNAHHATTVPTRRAPGKLWWCNNTTRKLYRYLIYILKTGRVVFSFCRTLTWPLL